MGASAAVRELDGERFRADPLAVLERAPAGVGELALGRERVLVVTEPELAHQVLVRDRADFVKTRAYRRAAAFLGKSLSWAEGAEHKARRSVLTLSFSARAIEGYAEEFAVITEEICAGYADGEEVDLQAEMQRLNLLALGRALFDTRLDARELVPAVDAIDAAVNARLTASNALGRWLPNATKWAGARALAQVDRVLLELIERARSRRGQDLLSLLVGQRAAQLAACGSSARDEALGLLIACQDTTPNALTWAVLLLLEHPAVLAELTEQVDGTLAGRRCTIEDLLRMPLPLAVFKETLRLYPPVFMTARQAVRDIEIGGVMVAEGQRVLINIYGLHRRAEVFSEPDAFRPERWLGDFEATLPRGAYIPFFEGPRRCLGSQYALMEGQIVLATLLTRLRLELRSPLPVAAKPFITLRPRSAVRVSVHPR